MALSDFIVRREEVKLPGGAVASVRGLNVRDAGVVVTSHLADLNTIMSSFEEAVSEPKPAPDGNGLIGGDQIALGKLVLHIAITAPELAATIIAQACDEPTNREAAASLPLPFQVSLLNAIGRLTFAEMSLGNSFAAVAELAASLGLKAPAAKVAAKARRVLPKKG